MKIQNRTEQTKYTFLNATMFWYNWLIYSPSLYKKKGKKKKDSVSQKYQWQRELFGLFSLTQTNKTTKNRHILGLCYSCRLIHLSHKCQHSFSSGFAVFNISGASCVAVFPGYTRNLHEIQTLLWIIVRLHKYSDFDLNHDFGFPQFNERGILEACASPTERKPKAN